MSYINQLINDISPGVSGRTAFGQLFTADGHTDFQKARVAAFFVGMKIRLSFLLVFAAATASAQTDTSRVDTARHYLRRDSANPAVLRDTSRVDTSRLQAAEVRAEKRLLRQTPYGTVVQIENSILTRGSSMLEVLQRSPGISIDYRNNGLSLNGKGEVRVMLDGRLLRMPMDQVFSLLGGMSADNVEKIELLTTPPARYDAEGSGGLINIVLKKNKKPGTSGTLSATAGYGWREKATATASIAHNNKSGNFYASYTYSHNRSYSDLQIQSRQNMPWLGGNLFVDLHDTTHVTHNNHDAAAGMDLRLGRETRLDVNGNFSSSNAANYNYNHQQMTVLPDSLLSFNGMITGRNNWQNIIGSGSILQELSPDERITAGGDYLYYHNDNPGIIQSSFLTPDGKPAGNNESIYSPLQRSAAITGIHVEAVHVDYQKKLSEKVKMEAGIKGTYTQDSSASSIQALVNNNWTTRSEATAQIRMRERINAFYTSFAIQLSPALTLDAGLRYEYSRTKITDPLNKQTAIDRKLGDLFPSMLLNWKVNDNNSWLLSYTRRISRPSYNDLASFVGYSDPGAIYTGNPLLKPTLTDNLKVGYNYKGYSFSLLLSHDDNPIARYQLSESPQKDLLVISPQNLRFQNTVSVNASIPWRINSWWTSTSGFVGNFTENQLDYTLQPLRYHFISGSVNISETILLPKDFAVEVSGWYDTRYYNGTIRIDGAGSVNAGIKKELKRSRSQLQLAIADLFRTEKYPLRYGSLTTEAYAIRNHVLVNTESTLRPIVKLTWSKNFGGESVKKNSRSVEEQSRVRVE